jgi:hypothetical protein
LTISPALTSITPAIIINSVLFPHPLGPTMLRNSPSETSKLTFRMASSSPYDLRTERIASALSEASGSWSTD